MQYEKYFAQMVSYTLYCNLLTFQNANIFFIIPCRYLKIYLKTPYKFKRKDYMRCVSMQKKEENIMKSGWLKGRRTYPIAFGTYGPRKSFSLSVLLKDDRSLSWPRKSTMIVLSMLGIWPCTSLILSRQSSVLPL